MSRWKTVPRSFSCPFEEYFLDLRPFRHVWNILSKELAVYNFWNSEFEKYSRCIGYDLEYRCGENKTGYGKPV